MREWNGRYRGDQRGAFLEAPLKGKNGHRRRSRSQQQRRSRSLPERRGGRNNEYHVNRCISMHDKTSNDARRDLTWYEVIPIKGENIRESIPGVSCFRAEEPEGESCGFDRLGGCGGRTDCVSGFVPSF